MFLEIRFGSKRVLLWRTTGILEDPFDKTGFCYLDFQDRYLKNHCTPNLFCY